jgi:hypothetical protein
MTLRTGNQSSIATSPWWFNHEAAGGYALLEGVDTVWVGFVRGLVMICSTKDFRHRSMPARGGVVSELVSGWIGEGFG